MQRIPPEYLDELVYDLYLYIDCILRDGLYIVDSSGFTCDRYEEKMIKMEAGARPRFTPIQVLNTQNFRSRLHPR